MRIVLVGVAHATRAAQGRLLAERLAVPYLAIDLSSPEARAAIRLDEELAPHTAGFVLDGFPQSGAQASALDDVLRRRAADVDAVVLLHGDAALDAGREAVLDHYRGRVVELEAAGEALEVHERVLAALREALVAA